MTHKKEQRVVYDPLTEVLNYYSARKRDVSPVIRKVELTVEERLKNHVVDGEKQGLEEDLTEALRSYPALEIVNTILLDGMKTVGDLFGRGEMQLPFVLQSAEVMKTAVAFLEPHMEKTIGAHKGTMVLATVKGDVHDIGKNLVDIILTNNGYRVINLGIKVPIDTILSAANEADAQAIGMSGLLVKSTLIMKENLEVMMERGDRRAVLLGGAALTRRYVEEDLGRVFQGPLFYCEDAFAGLRVMEDLASGTARQPERGDPLQLPASTASEVIKRFRIVRHRWNKILGYVSDADFSLSGQFGQWSVANIIAHFIGWERLLMDRLTSRDDIVPFPVEEVNNHNSRFVKDFAGSSREELMDVWSDVQTKLISVLQQVPDDVLTRPTGDGIVANIVADNTYAHEYEHLLKVQDWLFQRQKPAERSVRVSVERSQITTNVPIPAVPFFGRREVANIALRDVYPFINEIALFRGQWQFSRGKMKPTEYDGFVETTVRPIFEKWKQRAMDDELLTPRVVYGYYPCQAEGNDVIVFEDDQKTERLRFSFPRQTGEPHYCIADFFAPRPSGRMDVIGCMLVTVGPRASDYSAELFESNDYANYLYFHGLSVETAEALAEYWHRHMRREMGIAGSDHADVRKLFHQEYRGSRYSFGYPACPNLEDQAKLFSLLQPESVGVSLTEEFHLVPEQSTSAIVVHHPEARYFNL